MITILAKIQQFLDSGDIDGAREELARTFTLKLISLKRVNDTVRDFAALFALGSQKALEIGLGVLGRELLNNETEINNDVIWLLLAAVLSRPSITSDSPSRISILGLTACVKNWELPIFALLTPALDSFFQVSLSQGSSLIAEQTLDFIATWGEGYAKAPHSKTQLKRLKFLTQPVLAQVDDLDLKEEWSEGLDPFFQTADQIKYSDANIWFAAGDLLKKIYSFQMLSSNSERDSNDSKVKDNILRLITSSLASIETIIGGDGLSVAVRIDNPQKNNFWSVDASAIDKIQRLFEEVANMFNIVGLPTFEPTRAIPGSWTIILHIHLNSNQSNLLAKAIASLSSTEENESNSSVVDSWLDCVARLKKDDLRVDLAVSTNTPEWNFVRTISTKDSPKVKDSPNLEEYIRVLSYDVPQANSLERVLDFASLLIQYPSSPITVRKKFLEIKGITDRHFSYYRRSVEILGLADGRGQPTNACFTLNRLSTEAKIRFLAYQFISSNIGLAWFNWQNVNDLSDIQPDRATEFLMAVCPSLSETTAKRRAQTLQSWLKTFLQHW